MDRYVKHIIYHHHLPFAHISVINPGRGCCSKDKQKTSIVVKTQCESIRNGCLMNKAILAYKDILLKMVKGHYVGMDELIPLYKQFIHVETDAAIDGFNINKCD